MSARRTAAWVAVAGAGALALCAGIEPVYRRWEMRLASAGRPVEVAPAPAGAPSPGPGPAPAAERRELTGSQGLESLRAEIDVQEAVCQPLLERLKALGPLYGDGARLDGLGPVRERTRIELAFRRDDLLDMAGRYLRLWQALTLVRVGRVFFEADGEKVPASAQPRAKAIALAGRIERVLQDDEAAFTAALDGRGSRLRRARRLGYAACVALAILSALALLKARPRGRPARRAALPGRYKGKPPAGISSLAELGLDVRPVREIETCPFGRLLEAVEQGSGRRLVLEELRAGLRPEPGKLAPFEARMRKHASIRHHDLAELLSAAPCGGALLVYDGAAGKSLARRLGEGGRLEFGEACGLLCRIGRALHHAHVRGSAHGELTPHQVLLDGAGGLSVFNLGVAKSLALSLGRTPWRPAGGHAYCAPEQGDGAVSVSADIFSLGALLYEMVTGACAFEGPNFSAQKLEKRFRPATELRSGLPGGLDGILGRALSPSPAARHGSAEELAREVEALL